MTADSDSATRLYHCLIRELERRGRDPRDPLRVVELERDLVPYAQVRRDLGVELKADYEHALLRLLGGEHGLLRLEPAEAREELAAEAEAPYPAVRLFHKFDECSVWIEALPDDAARPASSDAAGPAASRPDGPAASGAGAADPAATAPDDPQGGAAPEQRSSKRSPPPSPSIPRPAVRVPRTGAPGRSGTGSVRLHRDAKVQTGQRPPDSGGGSEASCEACGGGLPAGRTARFCPWCGENRQLRPCSRCDARLEPGWRFCTRCGHEAAKGGG